MKFTWEANDIKGGVRAENASNDGGLMVVVHPGRGDDRFDIVALSDGLVVSTNLTKAGVAEFFNKAYLAPLSLPKK